MMDLSRFDQIAPAIWTRMAPNRRGASYDRMAGGYDAIVGNGIYNRLIWGCAKRRYARAASDFLMDAQEGPIIDFGCGSCVFTAKAYRGKEDRLLLFDRSLAMLARAAARLPNGKFLQGDALAPPFDASSFDGAMSWGMLHIFGTSAPYLHQLARLLTPEAPVAIATLVLCERRVGNKMLQLIHKTGEAAPPEQADAVIAAFAVYFDLDRSERAGNVLFLNGRKRAV